MEKGAFTLAYRDVTHHLPPLPPLPPPLTNRYSCTLVGRHGYTA